MTFEEWRDANEFGDCSPRAAWDAAVVNSKLIPEGYVLVPVEPTTAMEEAFLSIYERRGWFMRGYKNMIQAAQKEEL